MFAITCALIICLIISAIVYLKFKSNNKNVKKIPIPSSTLPILGNALDFKPEAGIIPLIEGYSKYGKIVKVSFGLDTKLIVSDCELIAHILSSKIISKGNEYSGVIPWLGEGLLTVKANATWKSHRKFIGRCFNKDIYKHFISAKILVTKWEKELDVASFDICKSISMASLDIIFESALGTLVNSQERLDSDIPKYIQLICNLTISKTFNLFFRNKFLYRLTKWYKQEQVAVKYLHDYAANVIEIRKRELNERSSDVYTNDNKKLTLLDLMLLENNEGKGFTDTAIQDEVQTFIFAGHDTVSAALCFTIYCLSNNPDVQGQVVEEFMTILADDVNKDLTEKKLNDMKYLEAVIKESLRLYPPVAYYTRTGHDMNFNEYSITKNMSLLINVFGIHRDKELFPEPEKFMPERFFNPIHIPFSYIPFNAGPRNCIGQKFAMLEMKCILVNLLKRFVILPTNPTHEVELFSSGILHSKNGIKITIKKRKI